MNIQPTFVTVWKKKHKSVNGKEICDMFLSYSTGKDQNKKYSNVSAVAFGETAKLLSSVNEKDRIKVLEGQMRFPAWTCKDTGFKKSKGELTVFKFEVVTNE